MRAFELSLKCGGDSGSPLIVTVLLRFICAVARSCGFFSLGCTVPFYDYSTIHLSILLLTAISLFASLFSCKHWSRDRFVLVSWCLCRSRIAGSQRCTPSREALLPRVLSDPCGLAVSPWLSFAFPRLPVTQSMFFFKQQFINS